MSTVDNEDITSTAVRPNIPNGSSSTGANGSKTNINGTPVMQTTGTLSQQQIKQQQQALARKKIQERKQWIQARNNQIEQGLSLSNQRSNNKALKLLLLGAGESGKSTVVKQMRLIHGTGFSDRERIQYTGVIWSDAVQSMRILISAAHELNISLDSDYPGLTPESQKLFEYNRLIMATDPVRQYEEDMPSLSGNASGSGTNGGSNSNGNGFRGDSNNNTFDSMVGSNGVPMPSRNFLDDYVLKYDRRRYDKYGQLEKSSMRRGGSATGSGNNSLEDDIIITRKVDISDGTMNGEQQGLLEDVEGEDYNKKRNDSFSQQQQQQQQKNSQQPYRPEHGKLPTKYQVATAISELWKNDKGIQECFRRANEFQLEVNAAYYFDKIFEYCKPGYRSTDQDILKGRIKTTGINETVINIKNWTFSMIDVGGQRSERRKWIHCFDDVTAIVFVAAVSEYDEVLFEDSTMNRMAEALLLFESICNSRWFGNTQIILFLNKIDKLSGKLATSPINRYFRDYTGDPLSVDDASSYFQKLFLAQNKNPRRPIYTHFTCATDTQTMKFVIAAVTDMIIQKSLLDIGMI